MADDPLEDIRLALMQDLLPVGIAMVERARKGGAKKVAEAFTSVEDPLEALRTEGEPAARVLREQLDKVSPGLGNPVVPVKVDVEVTNTSVDQTLDEEMLLECLDRIQLDIQELEKFLLANDSSQSTSATE